MVLLLLLDLVAFGAMPPLKDVTVVAVVAVVMLLEIASAVILVGVGIAASLELWG